MTPNGVDFSFSFLISSGFRNQPGTGTGTSFDDVHNLIKATSDILMHFCAIQEPIDQKYSRFFAPSKNPFSNVTPASLVPSTPQYIRSIAASRIHQ